ncbi:MAG: tetratricopeptide repeat protein [Candidatus Rokubacteria bacterium]|nr:tetratricopeptide repeat protein [Candidatus Rokubacteria bacterium]
MERFGRSGGWARALAVLAALLSITVGAGTGEAKARPLLVLPFQATSPGGGDDWIGEGLAESLILAFRSHPAFLPVDRARVRQAIRAAGEDPEGPLPERTVLAVARSVRAESVLLGEYRREGGSLTVVPRHLEVRTGGAEARSGEPLQGSLDRWKALQGDLVRYYLKALKVAGKPEEVQRLAETAGLTANLTAFEAFVKGRRAYLRGSQSGYEGAVELFGRAAELDPGFALAHFELGQAHLALGNRWKAAAQFRAASQFDPASPEPFKALGDLFMSSPRRLYEQAIEAYRRAIGLRPHYAEAYVGLGDARAAKGDYEAAIAEYQKALDFDPLNARVHFSLGRIYYGEKGLYYEAVAAYKKAIELDPYFLEARMGLGEVYEDKGLYLDAIAEYRKVVELDARHTGALYNLALVHEKVDPGEAIAHWERYIAVASQLPSEKDWVDVARQHLKKLKSRLEKP